MTVAHKHTLGLYTFSLQNPESASIQHEKQGCRDEETVNEVKLQITHQ
jgi:hypothetical protein